MKTKVYILIAVLLLGAANLFAANPDKPRVVVLTDSEVDDRCSMVHLLLCSPDMDIAALIETNSCFQRHGWSKEGWLEKQLDHYEEVYPNLKVHDPNYPTPDELRSKVFVGDEDPSHIVVNNYAPMRFPGEDPQIDPTDWADTPGSDRIVEILLEDDPRPVYIQAWGGGNTAAKAFQKLKDQYPEQYDRAVSKVVMYNIWYQDGAGSYIERYHPGVTMLLSHYFSGTWNYGSQNYTYDFVDKLLHNDHGSLGADYVQDFISEGDSPSFFYSIDNGLRSYECPTYGGWGGMFYKVPGFDNIYRDVSMGSFTRWTEYILRDFEMRLKWCVAPEYKDATHTPKVTVMGDKDITVKSGETVNLEMQVEVDDPDLEAYWEQHKEVMMQQGATKELFLEHWSEIVRPYSDSFWQYYEAGTYDGHISFDRKQEGQASFVAPEVTEPKTIHVIYEATGTGSPAVTGFARVIVTVEPK